MSEATAGASIGDAKRTLRRAMRATRRGLLDRPARSAAITSHLVELSAVAHASTLMAYSTVPGEVDTTPLVDWCAANSIEVAMPEDEVDPSWPDVIIVPGTAFTPTGARLGQGGGWYDRFLRGRRSDSVTIGVAFAPQIVDELPTERHDIEMDCVVTEDGARWRHDADHQHGPASDHRR